MNCPFCSNGENKVIDSRISKDGTAIRRRRECLNCKKRFTTYEYVEDVLPVVVKKDGRREAFDRSKIFSGIKKACEKRPISMEIIDDAVDRIEQECQDLQLKEIPTNIIGEKIMEELHTLDAVAYVRFASVYREFRDVNEFMDELKGFLEKAVPAMMISGPLYRGEKSVMTLLFLSTIVLTGPAWCSQLCYFGAIDNLMAKGKTSKKPIVNKFRYKHTILAAIVAFTLAFSWLNVSPLWAAIGGGLFGIGGFLVIFLITKKQKRMVHCTVYCPIGTVVNYLKYINPFRITISPSCDMCMACTSRCKYDALNPSDIQKKKPGITCTLCGDCLSACNTYAIPYTFLGLKPETARKFWLFLTISLFSIFLAMGRM